MEWISNLFNSDSSITMKLTLNGPQNVMDERHDSEVIYW